MCQKIWSSCGLLFTNYRPFWLHYRRKILLTTWKMVASKEGLSFVELGIQKASKLLRSLCKVWLLAKGSFLTFRVSGSKKFLHENISVGPYGVYEKFLQAWLKSGWFFGDIKRYTDKQTETKTQRQTDRHRMSLCGSFNNPVQRAALNSAAAERISLNVL